MSQLRSNNFNYPLCSAYRCAEASIAVLEHISFIKCFGAFHHLRSGPSAHSNVVDLAMAAHKLL
jgi:hypothetical protein